MINLFLLANYSVKAFKEIDNIEEADLAFSLANQCLEGQIFPPVKT